jgi:hypothetical protein
LNIVLFLFSSFDLIERDINLVLPCERNAARILDDLRSELSCAFRMREELINMKKVAYHLRNWQLTFALTMQIVTPSILPTL